MTLQLKKDLLNSIFGEENAKSFLSEVSEASKEREILHKHLLQTKSKLQVSFKTHMQTLPVTKINLLLSQFYRNKSSMNQLGLIYFPRLIKYSNKCMACCIVWDSICSEFEMDINKDSAKGWILNADFFYSFSPRI